MISQNMISPRNVLVLSKCGGQYLYFEPGVIRNLSTYSKITHKISSIVLLINIDGLPLFKSSSQQFWPILGKFNNLDVFAIALFYGSSKPNSVDEYLDDFLKELEKLQNDGIFYKERKLDVRLKCFFCDAPARCIIRGTSNGKVVFNSISNFATRTDAQFFSSIDRR